MSERARMIEGLNKHLQFAKQAVEDGWNARTERLRALNMQAALAAIENVMRENENLVGELYAESKAKVAKPAA